MEVYHRLHAHYGEQQWWPAETPFEMMVGAILTQNTRWENVEMAIDNLKAANMLNPESIISSDIEQLESLIRASGYFKQKARKLVEFSNFFLAHDGIRGLKRWPTQSLRARLLGVHGIGPETADAILLYALDKPVFVVDAYTKRIFSRLGLLDPSMPYDDTQNYFVQRLPGLLQLFQEYHALIVEHAKCHCNSKQTCDDCPLFDACETAAESDRLSSLH
jgi:endonuclease-3 related protein